MSDPMEPPPWAFDDCTAWTACRATLEDAGFVVKQIASWRLDDGDATRGDTMRRVDVLDEETGERLMSVIVEARAEAGFSMWIEASVNQRGDITETVLSVLQQRLIEQALS